MAAETGTYVEDLDQTRPDGSSEYVYDGDDHLKLVKKCLKQSFTGFAGGIMCYGADASSTATYAINPTTALPSYTTGLFVALKVTNTNTGASTLNISSLGAKTIKLPDGSAIPAGLLSTTAVNMLVYNGTDFILLFPTTYFTTLVFFDAEYDNGNSGAADTINWNLGNKQKSTLTGNATFTFTAPPGPCSLTLKLVQDGTGSRNPVWPATVKWTGGTEPVWSTAASAIDIVTLYYDGTNYYCGALLGFA